MLEQILPPHDIQMALDLGILARKAVHLLLTEPAAEPRVELAGELVVEFRQEFCVEEEVGGGGEFVCDGVKEDLRAVVFVGFGGALFGLYGENAEFDDVDTVTEEDCFAA